jgi:hypothetical protein
MKFLILVSLGLLIYGGAFARFAVAWAHLLKGVGL